MKKKGFTLIELLAVIVVLAIIALIASPIVLNLIDDEKKGSFRETVRNIYASAKTYEMQKLLQNKDTYCSVYSFSNNHESGYLTKEELNNIFGEGTYDESKNYKYELIEKLSLKGKLPTEGVFSYCEDNYLGKMSNGKYTAFESNGDITVTKGDLASTDTTTPVIDNVSYITTTNSIKVIVLAHSNNPNGIIANYYYSLDGKDYKKTTENNYTFTNLKNGEEYTVYVKVENKSGIKEEASLKIETKTIEKPSCEVNPSGWANKKIITCTYKGDFINQYSLDGKNWNNYTGPFDVTEEGFVIARTLESENNYIDSQSYNITKIDLTAPTNLIVSETHTSNSINVIASATEDKNDEKIYYEFSKDNGVTWTKKQELNNYEFKKLSTNTYKIKVRVTNEAGLSTLSDVKDVTTQVIPKPVCEITPEGFAQKKTIKCNYPEGYINEYSFDGENWIKYEEKFDVIKNGFIIARVNDGTNYISSVVNNIVGIDLTPAECTISISEYDITPKIIILSNCTDEESDISKYEYSKDSGSNYIAMQNIKFSLDTFEISKFRVKVTNGAGAYKVFKLEQDDMNELYNNLYDKLVEKKQSIETNSFLKAHPIGSIYITTSSNESTITKMNNLYGGTWEVFATDKRLVGTTSTVNLTGGNKTVKLSTSNIPSLSFSGTTESTGNGYTLSHSSSSRSVASWTGNHSHGITAPYSNFTVANNHGGGVSGIRAGYAAWGSYSSAHWFSDSFYFSTESITVSGQTMTDSYANSLSGVAAHTHTFTGNYTNSNQTKVNIENPYITVYMYKRVA